jgi:putative transcriptional regulator
MTERTYPESVRGRLLVATPDLADPNFSRTVVLMLEHGDEGALGVVLNRPIDLSVAEVLPDWVHLISAPACLFVGGPVAPTAVIGLGRGDGPVFQPLFDGLGTLDLDLDPAAYAPTMAGLRVFVGYAGWGPGQLETLGHGAAPPGRPGRDVRLGARGSVHQLNRGRAQCQLRRCCDRRVQIPERGEEADG